MHWTFIDSAELYCSWISLVFSFGEFAKYKLNFTQQRDNCLHIAGKIGMASSLTECVPSKKNSSHTLSNTSQIKQPWLLLSKTICSSWLLVIAVFIKWTSSSIFLTDNICLMPNDRGFLLPFAFASQKDYKFNSSTQWSYFKGIFLFPRLGRNTKIFELKIHF